MKFLIKFIVIFVAMYIAFFSIITSKDVLYQLGDLGAVALGSALAVTCMIVIDKKLFKRTA